jgi:hypothetical protein
MTMTWYENAFDDVQSTTRGKSKQNVPLNAYKSHLVKMYTDAAENGIVSPDKKSWKRLAYIEIRELGSWK